MAEERNEMSDADAIRNEIERTRIEMSETLGEIQDRLRPDHLLQQARDNVTEAAAGKVRTMMNSAGETAGVVAARARDTGDYLSRYVQDHPIRIAVTVGALTWWMLRGRDQIDYDGAYDTSWEDEDVVYGSNRRSLRDRVGEYASGAKDTVGEYAASARETVGSYATSAREAVGDYAESARSSAARAGSRARRAASSAYGSTGDWITDNPMAAGAIALAIGAAIGMSVPRTEAEDRTMGEARDQAWQRASQVARNLKDNVAEKVTNAAENLAADSVFGPPAPTEPPRRL